MILVPWLSGGSCVSAEGSKSVFIFIGISPIVIIILGCFAILVLGGHITAGLLIGMTAILAGAGLLTALGIAYMRYRFTHPGLSADFAPAQSRLTAQSIVTPDGIWQRQPEPVWPSQPRLSLAVPLDDEQLEAAARYLIDKYGREASLAELEAKGSDTHE